MSQAARVHVFMAWAQPLIVTPLPCLTFLGGRAVKTPITHGSAAVEKFKRNAAARGIGQQVAGQLRYPLCSCRFSVLEPRFVFGCELKLTF